mmetsp:Transcript_17856/g.26412  ORF Transcript_17856/g.26412 Transcript_17856/m.26412 type:complete len:726 (+) Transcript_17856:62-2239(+)|eukprot:CAMPEP_0194202096 /NCGR_PEP_ID=MMETSP0156-20130528/2199_1 /TAXON_ID=33649 /ORGANISM="Thalassionema nitzschioides, Strain L26-B" /LENGTH=725 /DNA_ID=CAMNT_0038927479 /DNA_START=61 /DNA_END=2238 /DNA_ORIENTATION=-
MAPLALGSQIILVLAIPVLLLDLVLYLLSLRWVSKLNSKKKEMYSTAVPDSPHDATKQSTPRRFGEGGKLVDKMGTCETVFEMMNEGIKNYGPKVAMITRTFLDLKKLKPTDRFPTKVYGDGFDKITYDELGENIKNFGAGLKTLGMESLPSSKIKNLDDFNKTKGKFIMVLFEDTCAQWTTALQGAFSQSIVVATCYATLGDDAVVAAVDETQATTLFCNWKKAEHFASLSKKMKSLKYIIASTNEMPAGTKIPDSKNWIQIMSSDEVMEKGKQQASSYSPVPPKPSDVAVIMYTSGSTGKPKGVVMEHSQLVSGGAGMSRDIPIQPGEERYVSYLPLAHILALQVENILLSLGSEIWYADPRGLPHILPKAKPTYFAGVPKVWETLQTGLEKKLSKMKSLKIVFDAMLWYKLQLLKFDLDDTPLINDCFFDVISKLMFGHVITAGISGGGPMSASLSYYCRAVFHCPIIQGYALTETCVGGTFQDMNDKRVGVVGPPSSCIEISLQSEPDITDAAGVSYLHTDKVDHQGNPVLGRGEVLFRGPCISAGYFKMPEKTAEEYDKDGWFHSGDIGQFTADGVLQIVDRKKNLIKLKGGEYVAIEPMENAFVQSPFCQVVCVIANGDLDGPLAIVRTDNEVLQEWAAANKCDIQSPEARKAVVQSMIKYGKEAGLSLLELRVKDCVLNTTVDWVPGNGMTATMKIDRKQIMTLHDTEIKEMLKRNGY